MKYQEKWRRVVGFSDYAVSNLGRMRSYKKGKGTAIASGGILRGTLHVENGIPKGIRVGLRKEKITYMRYIHRLALEAFVGSCPSDMECCHNDGDAKNNHLYNLRWDTRKANAIDAKKHGTLKLGEAHHNTSITENNVRAIRNAREKEGLELARQYGVSPSTISNIRLHKTWMHVK